MKIPINCKPPNRTVSVTISEQAILFPMENNNFGFGFNDARFSDRTIRLQILPDPVEETHVHDQKRARIDSTDALQQDSSDGQEGVRSSGNPSSTDYSTTQIKTIHISSIILANKSPFFYKLFTNGMAESNQEHVTLLIQESEVAAFMDLMKFMYANTLSSATQSALLDVLIVADRYEVASCMKYCIQSLLKLPMTCMSAVLYLNLPLTILNAGEMADTVQSLIDVAKEFLVARFNTISNLQEEEEMLRLPLACIETVLSRDDLQVASEDEIYDFIMKWAQRHYTNLGERQEILNTCLLRLIRFQFMSCLKLKDFLKCRDIDPEHSSEIVVDALSLLTPLRQLPRASQDQERDYKHRPVKVTRLNSPREECVVYLTLKREECARLYPANGIRSQPFDFCGQTFYLMGKCCAVEEISGHRLRFFLHMQENGSLGIEFEISSRVQPRASFGGEIHGDYDFTKATGFEFPNLFFLPWDTFIADDSCYFINGALQIRVCLRIKKEVSPQQGFQPTFSPVRGMLQPHIPPPPPPPPLPPGLRTLRLRQLAEQQLQQLHYQREQQLQQQQQLHYQREQQLQQRQQLHYQREQLLYLQQQHRKQQLQQRQRQQQ